MDTVIFACRHNAGRSQIAAGWCALLADPSKVRVLSAGTRPAENVNPAVVDVMREVGVDLSTARPQLLTAELARGATALVTMGCGDECPVVPGLPVEDWALPDPKGRDASSVRETRDEIRRRVVSLLERQGWLRD